MLKAQSAMVHENVCNHMLLWNRITLLKTLVTSLTQKSYDLLAYQSPGEALRPWPWRSFQISSDKNSLRTGWEIWLSPRRGFETISSFFSVLKNRGSQSGPLWRTLQGRVVGRSVLRSLQWFLVVVTGTASGIGGPSARRGQTGHLLWSNHMNSKFIWIHVWIHVWIHIFIYMNEFIYSWIPSHIWIHIFIYMNSYIHIHEFIYVSIQIHINSYRCELYVKWPYEFICYMNSYHDYSMIWIDHMNSWVHALMYMTSNV